MEVLEGRGPDRRFSIFSFPSIESVREFWNSSEYQMLKDMRRDAAVFDIWITPGIDEA